MTCQRCNERKWSWLCKVGDSNKVHDYKLLCNDCKDEVNPSWAGLWDSEPQERGL